MWEAYLFQDSSWENSMRPHVRHILKSQQFDRGFLERLFRSTDEFRREFDDAKGRKRLTGHFAGRLLFSIFYEESTRTRFSFEAAASHLGMKVVSTENAQEFSSAAKGETLEDTIRVLCRYRPDVIVLRHNEVGGAERAALVSPVPIINAGDGGGQHPTQALIDIYTIIRERGRVDGLTVVIGGDLAYGRTVRSLTYLLAKFKGVSIIFVAPPEVRIGEDIKRHLGEHRVQFREETSLAQALPLADVVYWTRLQRERMPEGIYKAVKERYVISAAEILRMRPNAVILHPLPRAGEITAEVDVDPRAAYFRQAGNGLFLRMALLGWVLGEVA